VEIHSADYTVNSFRLGNLMETKCFTDFFCGKLMGVWQSVDWSRQSGQTGRFYRAAGCRIKEWGHIDPL